MSHCAGYRIQRGQRNAGRENSQKNERDNNRIKEVYKRDVGAGDHPTALGLSLEEGRVGS